MMRYLAIESKILGLLTEYLLLFISFIYYFVDAILYNDTQVKNQKQ